MSINLSPEEASQVIGIAQEIIGLEKSEAFKHFKQAALALAERNTPRVEAVKGQEHAIEVASRLAFASGIKACFELINQQKEILKSLTK